MIAIAAHEFAQIGVVPLLPVFGKAVADFGDLPHVEGFVHNEQAHAVGEFEQFGRGRVVAGADGVDAHRLHDFELALQGAAVDGGAERAEIVVQADAVELYGLAV